MTPFEFTLIVFALSVVAGELGSLLGLGGGIIVIPVRTLIFKIPIHYAIGALIVSVIATSSGAAAAYVRERMTNLRVAMLLEIATTAGALTGAFVAGRGINAADAKYDGPMNPGEEVRNFGRNCLIARRLLERGVRFVQIWSGADNGFPRRNWDSHEDIARDHLPLGLGMATGAAALIKDLKQRGMLDDTIILWTTEFGRMPCSQGTKGRDHNPFVFSNWLAGGGIKGGVTVGESDEWSYKPADPSRPTWCYDVHATVMRLLGIDHKKLTFRNNGIDRRLTDVHGEVIDGIIA